MIKKIRDKESLLAFVDDYENLGVIEFGYNVLSLPFLTVESLKENHGTYTIDYRISFRYQEYDIRLDLSEISSGDFFIRSKIIFVADTTIPRRDDLLPYQFQYDYNKKEITHLGYNRNYPYSNSIQFLGDIIYLSYIINNNNQFKIDLIIIDKDTKKILDIEMHTYFDGSRDNYYLSMMCTDYPELKFFWDIEIDDPINLKLDDIAIKDTLMIVESLLI